MVRHFLPGMVPFVYPGWHIWIEPSGKCDSHAMIWPGSTTSSGGNHLQNDDTPFIGTQVEICQVDGSIPVHSRGYNDFPCPAEHMPKRQADR